MDVFKADLSIQPIAAEDMVHKGGRPPVYLVSYADGKEVFYKNQHFLTYSAQNKGFDIFYNYRYDLLDKEFVEKYKDILSVKIGAGLWLWKPQVILQTMRAAPENAIIIYTDVGICM